MEAVMESNETTKEISIEEAFVLVERAIAIIKNRTIAQQEKLAEQPKEKEVNQEAVQIARKFAERAIENYEPELQAVVLRQMLDEIPAKQRAYEEEVKRQNAVDELLNDGLDNLATADIILLTEKLKNNGVLQGV
jgi:hypothetical protein